MTTNPSKSTGSSLDLFPPDARASQGARIPSMAAYDALCQEAADDFDGFWARQAKANVAWTKPFTRTLDESNAPFYKWFEDGELNASTDVPMCLSRQLAEALSSPSSNHL